MEGYYQDAVHAILDNVVEELRKDERRRYIQVETSFLARWWQDASDVQKAQFKGLVAAGRLEIVNGGWVMSDEAVVGYPSVVDQMTEGHEWILKNIGVTPRIAWHIDPFGASCATPAMFADMGFDAFIENRIPYATHDALAAAKSLEFVWRSSAETSSRGKTVDMFTHVLDHHYCSPKSYDFEASEMMNPPITPANVKSRSDDLVAECKSRAALFRHSHLLLPLGCDFEFQNASKEYDNMDMLINYINAHSAEYGVDMAYSTLSEYIDAVHALDISFPRYEDDFFPYADNINSFWSGFFVSRPWLKGYATSRASLLRTIESMHVLSSLRSKTSMEPAVESIDVLRQATSLVQHHDAITGTEKLFVAQDYADRLTAGTQVASPVLEKAVRAVATVHSSTPSTLSLDAAPLQALSAGATVAIVLHNGLAWDRPQVVRVAIPVGAVAVTDANGTSLPAQVNPSVALGESRLSERYVAASNGSYELFIRVQLPPMGFTTVFVSPVTATHRQRAPAGTVEHFYPSIGSTNGDPVVDNNNYQLVFSQVTGRLTAIAHKATNRTVAVQEDLLWYEGQTTGQASGAYIFHPSGNTPTSVQPMPMSVRFVRGPLVQEAMQIFNGQIRQAFRLYTDAEALVSGHVELQAVVGVLTQGKELVARFTTDLKTQGTLMTDLNAWEMHTSKRSSQYAPNTVASNFHPIISCAALLDPAAFALVVNTERPEGAASLADGQLEIMMHRRLLADDARGAGEPLDDTLGIDTTFHLTLVPAGRDQELALAMRRGAYELHYPVTPLYSACPAGSRAAYVARFATEFEPMRAPLPQSLHLLTLAPRGRGLEEVVIRLAHIFSKQDAAAWAQPVTVDLSALLSPDIVGAPASLEERTLSLNRPAADLSKRLTWLTDSGDDSSPRPNALEQLPVVTILPMEMRTFVARW